jgi:hypothetical protein
MPESQYSITASISVGEMNPSFVTWNSATALNSTAVLVNNDISYNTLNISLNQTTTITGGVVTFQGSFDGTNWFNVTGWIPGTSTVIGPTYTLQASTYAIFQFNLTAIPYFQVLLSTAITGTGAVTIGYAADSFVGSYNTVSGSVAVSGTVAVSQSTSPWIVAGGGTAGAPGTAVLTVQGITGGTPIPVSGTFAASGTLTNNNAAPVAASLLGTMAFIAETAYNTVTYTTGNVVMPVTDLHGALNQDLQAVAGVALGATAVTNFGTAPAAAAVPGVNSSIFSGTTALTNTGGSLNVNITGTVTQATAGTLTNNNAAPIADNLGVLGFIAETAYTTVTYTTGNQVLAVTDLHGALNTDLQAVGGSVVVTAAAGIQKVGIVGNASAVLDAVIGAGSAAPNMIQVGGVFNTTAPTLTTGQSAAMQLDAHSNLMVDPFYWAGTALGATAVVAYGSTPAAVNVPAVNAFVTNTVTATGNKTNNNAAPGATNFGTLPAIVAPSNTTFPTYTTGDQVALVTDLAGNTNTDMQYWAGSDLGPPSNYGTSPGAVTVPGVNAFVTNTVAVDGALTNNNAAPTATLIGVMDHIAETAYTTVTYTTGDVVLATTDLHGATNVDLQAYGGTQLTGTVTAYGTAPTGNVFGVNSYLTQFPAAAASADALANPTITQVGAENMLFNGTTWDRQRNNVNTTTGDTGTHTASFNGATQTNYNARGAFITIVLGTVSGGTLSFSAQLQWSPDGGTTWFDIGNALTGNMINTGTSGVYIVYPTNISQSVGNGPQNIDPNTTAVAAVNIPLPRTWRLAYTIGGTTPSYTFTGVYVNYIL